LQSGGGNASNGALVGAPWKSDISNWPGVSGNDGQSNFYALNKYPVDLQTQMLSGRDQMTYTQAGGKHRRRKKRGGASGASIAAPAFGQDLSNLGRGITWGLGSAYNTLNGYPTAVNPLPYRDQLTTTASTAIKDMSYSGSRI
jgi:hypothetical protein